MTAKEIAKHEQPQVDPDLEKARELAKELPATSMTPKCLDLVERDATITAILAGIKYGRGLS